MLIALKTYHKISYYELCSYIIYSHAMIYSHTMNYTHGMIKTHMFCKLVIELCMNSCGASFFRCWIDPRCQEEEIGSSLG